MVKIFKFDNAEIQHGAGGAGTSGQVLTSNGPAAAPTWQDPPAGEAGAIVRDVVVHADAGAAATYTNMALAASFLFASVRHVQLVRLSGATQCRLLVNKQATAGAAASILRVCYASAYSTAVGSYANLGTSPCQVATNVQNTYLNSGWVDIEPAALAAGEVFLAIIGSGGDGVLDPQFGSIVVSLR